MQSDRQTGPRLKAESPMTLANINANGTAVNCWKGGEEPNLAIRKHYDYCGNDRETTGETCDFNDDDKN